MSKKGTMMSTRNWASRASQTPLCGHPGRGSEYQSQDNVARHSQVHIKGVYVPDAPQTTSKAISRVDKPRN